MHGAHISCMHAHGICTGTCTMVRRPLQASTSNPFPTIGQSTLPCIQCTLAFLVHAGCPQTNVQWFLLSSHGSQCLCLSFISVSSSTGGSLSSSLVQYKSSLRCSLQLLQVCNPRCPVCTAEALDHVPHAFLRQPRRRPTCKTPCLLLRICCAWQGGNLQLGRQVLSPRQDGLGHAGQPGTRRAIGFGAGALLELIQKGHLQRHPSTLCTVPTRASTVILTEQLMPSRLPGERQSQLQRREMMGWLPSGHASTSLRLLEQ